MTISFWDCSGLAEKKIEELQAAQSVVDDRRHSDTQDGEVISYMGHAPFGNLCSRSIRTMCFGS